MENKFICPLPWVSLSIGVNNTRRLCCHETRSESKMTPEDLSAIQAVMETGAIPMECQKCASLEAHQIPSPRHQYLKDFPDFSSLQYLDLVINNDCNLECLMCAPAYSVKLNKIYAETYPQDMRPSWRLNLNELEQINLSKICVINIIGGEPLISKDAFIFLEQFLAKNSLKKLRIISNFTKLPEHWKPIFESVEELELIASIDATEKLYEFIRYPAKFEVVKSNILKLKSWKLENLSLRQHVVLMNLNFPYLKEILDFHEEFFSTPNNRLPICVEISSPQVLHPRVLTPGLWENSKRDALLAISQMVHKYGPREEFEDLKILIKKMEQIDLKHLYLDYQIYLQKIRKHHP